jgi:CubicO group peptidase (beta-lactamase class C family)
VINMSRLVRSFVALVGVFLLAWIGIIRLPAQERVVVGGPPQRPFAPPPISASQSPAELEVALDAYLRPLVDADRFSGVLLLARDGAPVFHKAYGLADRSAGMPNTIGTRFNLSSINKVFTSAAIAQLKTAGRVKGDDTIGALLPDYPNPQARGATIDQLLNHRGGVSDFFGPEFAAMSPARFRSNADYFAFVAPRPLLFEPGSQRRYCNGCYIVLGEIIAKVSGMPYEQFMQENVFAPRGMADTGWLQSDVPAGRVAMGYSRRVPGHDGRLTANLFTRGASGSAAGGGFSTTGDLLKFVKTADRMGAEAFAGGSPGSSTLVEGRGPWTAIVLTNLDPPAASVGVAVLDALAGEGR